MEKEEYTQEMIDQIICNVIGFSQANGDLLRKYSDQYFLSYFDRLKIDETIKKVPAHQKQLEMAEFVRLFLSVVAHKPEQTLYLTISLVSLFKRIKQDTNNQKGVKFSDFTSFLCNKISEGDPDLVVPMKQIPIQRIIPDTTKVRDIDINPPPILSKVQVERPKITKDKNKKDKKLDEKKPVSKFIYSSSLNLIIILGRLSSSITLYDPKDLKIKHKIIPSTCKLMSKDVAILSIAYCERDQRIGCIINNIGIAFWEAADNFATQKILGANKTDFEMKACGDKIEYLNLFNQWITYDKDTIYFWDIKQEVVVKTIHRQHSTLINDICEINHIRALLVSYNIDNRENKKVEKSEKHSSKLEKLNQHEQKILVLYQQGKQKSKVLLGNPGCHAICYNPSTQLVICLGYQSNISVYEIDAKTFDINLISQLQAHTSILTCVCNIPESSMIISGDDIGHVKLWQLNYMRCLQSIRIAKSITQIACSNNMLIYSDSRINTIPLDCTNKNKIIKPNHAPNLNLSSKDEESYGIYQFFRKQEESLWIITRKEARQFSIRNGRIKNIYILCNNQQDVSSSAQLFNGFLIGTSRGELSKFAYDGQRKWKIMAHQGQIHSIKMDLQNHLIVTIGGDNNLFIWQQKTITQQEGARKKISFQHKDINIVEVCPYANLLLIGSSNQNKLIVWNYDNLKLAYILEFDAALTSLLILPDKFMFIVATIDGCLSIFTYARKESKLKINFFKELNINNIKLQASQKKIMQKQTCQKQQQPSQEMKSQTKMDAASYIVKLAHCEDNNMIIGATHKGILYAFEPSNFYSNSNYRREYEPTPTLKRPIKQSFEHELLKNQFIKSKSSQMEVAATTGELSILWYMPVHKDTIFYMGIVNLQSKYVCTLCTDGYFKLVELSQEYGAISCSHKMNFPLPVKWEIDAQNYCDLKNQIHQAIVVIDSIIKNFSYQLSLKEQASLNITPFMERMITEQYQVKQTTQQAQTMEQEFTQADVKQIPDKHITLKNLQAYKRLQMIKKQSQPDIFHKQIQQIYHYETSASEKQSIRNFLQPSYLPKLLNKNISQIKQVKKLKGNDLVSKIDEIFNNREKKQIDKQKEKDKQNKYGVVSAKTQVKLDESLITISKKNNSCILDQTTFIKDKTVKQILGEINMKLSMHKRVKNKVKQSFSTFPTV